LVQFWKVAAMAGNYREYRNREEMVSAGWSIASTESTCRNCGGSISWAKSPKGKSVPLDSNSTRLHFKSCNGVAPSPAPTRPAAADSSPPRPTAGGNEMAELREALDECAQAVRALCSLLRARAEAASK
jgi:hypothetical protein